MMIQTVSTNSVKNSNPKLRQKTLHETVSKKIHRTKTGRIFAQDLKNIYSILLINLNLTEKPTYNRGKNGISLSHLFTFRAFGKHHPYSFFMNDAINQMAKLCLDVNLSPSTSTSISYQIKSDLALSLIQMFFIAKLLHTPHDRTRSKPKENVVMQPTPKGVSILYTFCKQHGIKNDKLPLIVKSNFNSMNLTTFDRNQFDDKIVYSDYLVHLLFLKLMGPSPNIWSPQNDNDPIPTDIFNEISDHQQNQDFNNFLDFTNTIHKSNDIKDDDNNDNDNNDNDFNNTTTINNNKSTLLDFGEIMTVNSFGNIPKKEDTFLKPSKTDNGKCSADTNNINNNKRLRSSPFAHKFFTNPESDSHVQYYVSNRGVRLYYNHRYSSNASTPDVKDITVQYSFIGKTAWQWLMDCTDITSKDQAADIMSLFVKSNLIRPILDYPSTAPVSGFQLSKTAFYTITKEGWEIIRWDRSLSKEFSSKSIMRRSISLQERLSELSKKPSLLVSNSNDSQETAINYNTKDNANNVNVNVNITNPSLRKVLKDPGLRYLFRKHLEKEVCVENFDSYNEIMKFNSEMMKLKKYLKQKEEMKRTILGRKSRLTESERNKLIIGISNDCMTSAYNIYGTYLTIGAPYELNIDHLLKYEINKVMMHPDSPINQKTHSEILSEFGSATLDLSDSNKRLRATVIQSSAVGGGTSKLVQEQGVTTSSSSLKRRTKLNLSIDITKIKSNGETSHSFLSDSDSSVDSRCEDNFGGVNDKESTLIEREIPLTPTEATVKGSLSLLNQIYPLLNKVGVHMFTLMQIDSLPKFFKSDIFNDPKDI